MLALLAHQIHIPSGCSSEAHVCLQGLGHGATPSTPASTAASPPADGTASASALGGGVLGSTAAVVGDKLSSLVGGSKPETQLEGAQGDWADHHSRAKDAPVDEAPAGAHGLPVGVRLTQLQT